MGMMANIVCKTVGIAGLSAVAYDALKVGQHHSKWGAEQMSADTFEHIYDAQRTTSNESYVTNAMQAKVADLRMNNPIVPIVGKVKGFCSGVLHSLGENIIPVTCASLAIATKGFFAKAGAWGLGIYGAFKVLHDGFGVGKKTPIDS